MVNGQSLSHLELMKVNAGNMDEEKNWKSGSASAGLSDLVIVIIIRP